LFIGILRDPMQSVKSFNKTLRETAVSPGPDSSDPDQNDIGYRAIQ